MRRLLVGKGREQACPVTGEEQWQLDAGGTMHPLPQQLREVHEECTVWLACVQSAVVDTRKDFKNGDEFVPWWIWNLVMQTDGAGQRASMLPIADQSFVTILESSPARSNAGQPLVV